MKDKRNCGVPYPVYPQVIIPPVQTPYMAGYNQGYNTSRIPLLLFCLWMRSSR